MTFLLIVSSLLFYTPPVTRLISPTTASYSNEPLDLWSSSAALSCSLPPCVSPSFSSSPPVAYLTNISSMTHWQQEAAEQVNATRLLELLNMFTSFDSRHPFVAGGNASLTFLRSQLENLGGSVVEDWFPIYLNEWNGTAYNYNSYWTANLYTMFGAPDPDSPTLIVTAHVDSARYTIFGLDPNGAPGANANAAGVSALLETIRILFTQISSPSNWNVCFAFLNGEEGNGTLSLWGSQQMISQGFSLLGINPATAFALNVDEIGYPGLIWPTELAIYRYVEEELPIPLAALRTASSILNIPLIDQGEPRVASLEEVQTTLAWCNSEWTFHIQNVPSLTISTNLYPDPFKHTSSDIASRCNLENIQNCAKLLIALIFGLTSEIPEKSPNHVADWLPVLSTNTSITIVDYLNFSTDTYAVLVIDPALYISVSLLDTLFLYHQPILALGKAGAELLQQLTGSAITITGTKLLTINGIRAFHPAIRSPTLLHGDSATPFLSCPKVYAIAPEAQTVVLVGDTMWCSMGYYPESKLNPSILFLGIDTPTTETVASLVQTSLTWLLEGSTMGLCLGIHHPAPQVGTSTIIYILMYNFTTWTGIKSQPILLNITTSHHGEILSQHMITNQSGIATLTYWIRSPQLLNITAQTEPNISTSILVLPSATASTKVTLPSQAFQGQLLFVECWVTSKYTLPTYVNLSLSHPLVGSVNKTNLLLMPDINLYYLQFSILPYCPPGFYTLTLSISLSELLLLIEPIQLEIKQAFFMTLIEVPAAIIQQQPFEVLIDITNVGPQSYNFDIIAEEGNFAGSTQLSLEANYSTQLSLTLVYLPSTIMDIGVRNLTIGLYEGEHKVARCPASLRVEFSTMNSLITLFPPIFLVGLCLLVIYLLKQSRGPQQIAHHSQLRRVSPLNSEEMLVQLAFTQSLYQCKLVQSYPYSATLEKDIIHTIRRLGLIAQGPNHFYNQHAAVTCERQGELLRIRAISRNKQFLAQFLSELPPLVNYRLGEKITH